jgi:hypothetical protein
MDPGPDAPGASSSVGAACDWEAIRSTPQRGGGAEARSWSLGQGMSAAGPPGICGKTLAGHLVGVLGCEPPTP